MTASEILGGTTLTAADILRAGAPVGNRNAAGAHQMTKNERLVGIETMRSRVQDFHQKRLKRIGKEHESENWQTANWHPSKVLKEFRELPENDTTPSGNPADYEKPTPMGEDEFQHRMSGVPKSALMGSSASPSDAIQARAASDVIYAGATANFTVTASSQWELGKPVEFMYMPGGVHTICAHFRGQAIKLTVAVDPSDAAKVLNGSLEQLRASYKHPPFGCVEHEEKDASVWAKQFTAKGDGVYLAADPSELGVRHVNGLVHRSWSPSFLTDADYSKATLEDGTYQFPDGVRGSESNPAKITGCAFCLGTLTNKPAFREMSPVKAREAGAVKAAEPTKPTESIPFNASALLDVARALRLAHWNGNTATNEHEALGELYDAWEDGLDDLVEATCGKRGCKVSEPEQGNTALAEQALAALSGVKDTLTAEDDDLLNIVADMENAVNKGRYLLKAKESDMTASEVLKATWSDAARKAALEARKNHNLADEDKWNVFGPGTSAHDQNANSFQIEVPGGNLRGDSVQYNINPLSRRKGFGLSSAGHPHSPGLWQEHGTFNTHKQAMKAAHEHYHTTISEAATSKASDASPSPSFVRALTAADILNQLAPCGADGKPAVK